MQRCRTTLAVVAMLIATSAPISKPPLAQIAIGVSIRVAPPVLPVYVQPAIPGPDYIWVPGYWAWDVDDYYWVPGTWVLAPAPGLLWTPGYWGWRDGFYVWNTGYWGPHVGFYGGINYGFGYTGVGYQGGYWSGGVFMYNRAVTNISSVHITNVYNKTVINNTNVTNVSFNGGTGGTTAHPTPQDQAAALDKHIPATDMQTKHQSAAGANRDSFASVNHGHPVVAATAAAGVLAGAGVVAAKGVKTLSSTRLNSTSGPPGTKQTTAAKHLDARTATGVKTLPNTLKSTTGQPATKHATYAKHIDAATTKQQLGKTNFPSGGPGPKYTRQVTTPKGIAPHPVPKQVVNQARKPAQPGKKPEHEQK